MISDGFKERVNEISDFIEIMEFFENLENKRLEDGRSGFDEIFHHDEKNISITYQSLINILKSNASLMIYNLIESTVMNSVTAIYDQINEEGLSYSQVSESIRKLWRNVQMKPLKDPNSNYTTISNQCEKIINHILESDVINLNARNTVDGGNLDCSSIKNNFSRIGITIDIDYSKGQDSILSSIKEHRNQLAHGQVTFIDALKQKSIGDINIEFHSVKSFLEDMNKRVEEYIDAKKYRA
jgi:hypothetical protein